MTTILHIDSSARPGRSDTQAHGSHTRRLSAKFIEHWRNLRPGDDVIYRDVGTHPPTPVSGDWIHAAFTKPEQREDGMHAVLAESDTLIDELFRADVIVAGVPMYNFGMPAQMKAWIDNIVRVGRTFGFDRSRKDVPYWPMVTGDKSLVVLSARGDFGYDPGGRVAHLNHVEAGVCSPLEYIGITDHHTAAIEYDEFGDDRTAQSIARAEAKTAEIVEHLVARHRQTSAA
ncbi:FMN-dependent NADH-azoreductase [Thalassospira sp.]|uniref:FMN-dependent NADH-azoreductase n=1 Tax=Thalassospira sp. TaxID=1912094 RepID=UPI00273257D8|nr:NAD(P)H-dependent oxidoreductase [Thalassospira sp.]MDP2700198.1 NAD(P)H-dependent oxidoreductase [Thalassospira sp.]